VLLHSKWISLTLRGRGTNDGWSHHVELTSSYARVFPPVLLDRYDFVEVRNAAATVAGTNPDQFQDIVDVLQGFHLTLGSLTDPGRNKSEIAATLDTAFRKKGWREAGHKSETVFTLRIQPYDAAGETKAEERVYRYISSGHKVDNVRGRVALDVEWNAKDGNLDRDLSNFRALHDAAVIDAGVIITRHHERTKYAANYLAHAAGAIRYNSKGDRIILLGTSTTTNLEKLRPRLERGDGGGCPVLTIAITDRCYVAGTEDPALPPFAGPISTEGITGVDVEEEVDEQS
jgi:Restriction endonuclease BglII